MKKFVKRAEKKQEEAKAYWRHTVIGWTLIIAVASWLSTLIFRWLADKDIREFWKTEE